MSSPITAVPPTQTVNIKEQKKPQEQKPKTAPFTYFHFEDLHSLLTKNDLQETCSATLGASFSVINAGIFYYGPKSTGKGWIHVTRAPSSENTPGAALNPKAAKECMEKLSELQFKGQKCKVHLAENQNKKSKAEKAIKRDIKKKSTKKALPFQEELEQFSRKYPEDFQCESGASPIRITFKMKPSDPDFPYDIQRIHVEILIPETYPKAPCEISVLNEDIPEKIRDHISNEVRMRAANAYVNRPMLVGLTRWLNTNLEKLMVSKEMTTNFELERAGFQFLNRDKLADRAKEDAKIAAEIKRKKEEEEALLLELEASLEEEEEESTPDAKFGSSTAHRGTQIYFTELNMVNVGLVECTVINIVLQCARCRTQVQISLSPEHSNGGSPFSFGQECQKCSAAHTAVFRSEAMHENSKIVGYLDLVECQPLDLLPCNYQMNCMSCSSVQTLKKLPHGGDENHFNCQSCHARGSLSLGGPKFQRVRIARPLPTNIVIKKKKEKDPSTTGIRVGQPLPDEGACQHYKKSKRWLRFPCCDRAFPCDICHDNHNTDGHEMKWANRMICGFCSREQPYSDKPCVCGASMTSGAAHHFWEGGKGCRNVLRLNRNDSHKHKNQNKTQSQKDKRVGQKGAAIRDNRSAVQPAA
ncbi:hypothetical protein PROFUN_11690 [Planoprotostelium fungivorum]|uniref:CHY-type domain-containing protein n=1 Tax=Planoprotostelium fungivorum TaxID=1890364 RepID=A0A2P6N5B1_9EUKA|nr:hypothetical protein PROFUN_11690 [Planoprotostelium fungivorum]